MFVIVGSFRKKKQVLELVQNKLLNQEKQLCLIKKLKAPIFNKSTLDLLRLFHAEEKKFPILSLVAKANSQKKIEHFLAPMQHK